MIGFTFVFVVLVSINSFVHSDEQLKQKFEAENVIPEVVDTVPASSAEIKYGSTVEVKLGNELTPAQVKNAPTNVSWPVESNAMYTLIMVDPDAPSRQHHIMRAILHWMVINIPGSDLSKGQTKQSYAGSGPPEGSGLHRYVFLVYKQTGQLSLTENDKDIQQKRHKFSVKEFARKYNLGQPVAGNFYQAQFDDYARQKYDRSLAVAMKTHQVVPDVIDTAPAHSAQIKYPNGHLVLQGRELTPTQVKDIPSNVTWPTEPNTLYTLVFSDPDAPSRQNPIRREMLHWLVVNIPGTDIAKGETYTEYIGSGAPEGTGLHRYVFLVYKQTGQLSLNRTKASNQSREGRPNFRVREFAKQNKLGTPVAGNFFQAQYDDYVPILRAQLSGQKTN